MTLQVSSGDIGLDNLSFANSTKSNISQFSKSDKDDKNSSWFRSLRRNLSSKKRGKQAKSGGNISQESSVFETPGRRIKSEWDICDDDRGGAEEAHRRALDTGYDNLAGLDLAQRKYGKKSKDNSSNLFMTLDPKRMAKLANIDKHLLHGIKQFNLDPSKGLEILEERGFVKIEEESLASFLLNQERLSKKQIGSYLGSREEFNQKVLQKFVELHKFTNLLLVQALRQFLWSFRLPGEAQQIDRIMSVFAAHYCIQNSGTFTDSDTVYILSFAIIMLNTALHNKNVKVKITEDQFIAQNKGINAGKDLPREMLLAIYTSIKEEPFKIPDETYDDLMFTFFSPDKEGWLVKQGGSWKSWKRRWFVLNDGCLYYFQHTAENVPKGIIPLDQVAVRTVGEEKDSDRPWQFEIFNDCNIRDKDTVKGCKLDKSGTVVMGNHKVYRMSAASEEDREAWVSCLDKVVKKQRMDKFLKAKKERHLSTKI